MLDTIQAERRRIEEREKLRAIYEPMPRQMLKRYLNTMHLHEHLSAEDYAYWTAEFNLKHE